MISSIVFGNLERGTFSISDFYRRRIRRIFPALVSVLLACAIFGWLFLFSDEFRTLGKHIAASTLFLQNFVLWSETGYFDSDARAKPLLHLWSLAIEEQFYIFWPVLLAIIWSRRWSFLAITATIAVVSFAINIRLDNSDPYADFYSPLSRFWELMVGGLLAYIALHRSALLVRHQNARSVAGFACLGAGTLLINASSPFPGWWALLPTLGAFFIISAGPTAILNRYLLGNRAMVGLGLISYPLYLWHWPILSFKHILRPYLESTILTLALVALAIAMATGTYYLVERPFRRNIFRFGTVSLVSAMSLLLVTGGVIAFLPVAPRLYDEALSMPTKTEWDFLKTRIAHFEPNGTGVYRFDADRKRLTVFVGDSQLAQYAERVFKITDRDAEINGAVFAIGGGCVPIRDVFTDDRARKDCWEARDEALAFARDRRVTTVVIGASWNFYFSEEASGSGYYYLEHGVRWPLRSPGGQQLAFGRLRREIADFEGAGKRVYLLLGNPIATALDPHVYVNRLVKRVQAPERFATVPASQEKIRFRFLELARETGATPIDPYRVLCDKDRCRRISVSGIAVFKDESHFNPDWALTNASFVDVALSRK